MKKVFIVLLAVFSLSSFAAEEKIDCKVVAEAQSGRAEFNEVFTKKNSLESVKLCYAMATEIGVAYADRNPVILLDLTDSFSTKSFEITVKKLNH